MSEVITDKLTGRATADDVTITSEGGSATMQLQQGVAKAWCYVEGDALAPLINSFNGSSLTDDGTGDYTYNLTNSFDYAKYSVTSNESRQPSAASVGARLVQCDSIVAGSYGINTYAVNSGILARLDDSVICTAAFGDLA